MVLGGRHEAFADTIDADQYDLLLAEAQHELAGLITSSGAVEFSKAGSVGRPRRG